MGTATMGIAQKENRKCGVDQQDVFDRVALFLAAITARLLNRILGALDTPFRPIVPKRGMVGAGAGAAGGTIMGAASASATPRRCANAVTDRVGTSPSARSAALSTTKRT
jgi:hypothetical protein